MAWISIMILVFLFGKTSPKKVNLLGRGRGLSYQYNINHVICRYDLNTFRVFKCNGENFKYIMYFTTDILTPPSQRLEKGVVANREGGIIMLNANSGVLY